MYVKLYLAVWSLLALVAGGVAVTGNFSVMVAVAYGFISFGMVFMGMMSVLPSIVSTPEGRAALCKPFGRETAKGDKTSASLWHGLHDWFFPRGIEMSPPKHH